MKKLEKSEKELLTEISEKLTKLITISSISGKDTNTQIKILDTHGFSWDEIGKLVGLTAEAARKRLERS